MAIMTYLEIVNKALAECKVSLDPLTSVNFADPPRTVLYNHFKRWANDVYKELMLERPEWFFRNERTTVTLSPRLHLTDLTYIPAVDDVLVGSVSGVQFTVTAVHTFEDNEEDTTVERTVDVEYVDGDNPADFEVLEVLDRVSPSPASAVATLAHAGRYNFSELTGFDELDMNNVRSFYGNVPYPVTPILWENWINRYNYYPFGGSTSHPEYITQAPDGNYEFFAQPIEPFTIEFNYARAYSDMELYSDTPVGVPEKYQDILTWMVVAEFADFDNNTRLFARAQKKLNKYNYFLFRDELPEIGFQRSKFNIRG